MCLKKMPARGRIVIPELPHHIIQRGNRRQKVFFCDQDRQLYVKLLLKYARKAGVVFWAYCLMENHVHFIAVPSNERSLAAAFGSTHKVYTKIVNEREGWKGFLWQGRFLSFAMDEIHLYAAVRYVELNPVRAGIVKKAEAYPWSSAKAHVLKTREPLVSECFLDEQIKDWASYLGQKTVDSEMNLLRNHTRSGLPLGREDFIAKLEKMTGMTLRKKKPGPRSMTVKN
jgi:putative transposase